MLFYRILSTPPELDKELSGLLQICTSLSQTEHVDSQHMLRGVSILTSFRYNLNKKKSTHIILRAKLQAAINHLLKPLIQDQGSSRLACHIQVPCVQGSGPLLILISY